MHGYIFCGTGESSHALLMKANKSDTTALYRAPTFSLLLVSHGGISSCTCTYMYTYLQYVYIHVYLLNPQVAIYSTFTYVQYSVISVIINCYYQYYYMYVRISLN